MVMVCVKLKGYSNCVYRNLHRICGSFNVSRKVISNAYAIDLPLVIGITPYCDNKTLLSDPPQRISVGKAHVLFPIAPQVSLEKWQDGIISTTIYGGSKRLEYHVKHAIHILEIKCVQQDLANAICTFSD